MKMLVFLAVVPAVALFSVWLQLIVTDEISFGIPIASTMVAGGFAWYAKDSAKTRVLGPIILGCAIGATLAFLFVGPAIAALGISKELEDLKRSDPGQYEFTMHSTAIIPLNYHHQKLGLKIAIPIGMSVGLLLGAAIVLSKQFRSGAITRGQVESQ